jgi:hypothetical protein
MGVTWPTEAKFVRDQLRDFHLYLNVQKKGTRS